MLASCSAYWYLGHNDILVSSVEKNKSETQLALKTEVGFVLLLLSPPLPLALTCDLRFLVGFSCPPPSIFFV